MKALNIFFAVMFFGFAALQINDPDPVTWILIYLAMTVACTIAVYNKYDRRLMVVQGAVYLVYIIILWPGVIAWLRSPDRSLLFDDLAKMQYSYIEETREVLGLTICLAVLALLWVQSGKHKNTRSLF
jgi:hypothetical protein